MEYLGMGKPYYTENPRRITPYLPNRRSMATNWVTCLKVQRPAFLCLLQFSLRPLRRSSRPLRFYDFVRTELSFVSQRFDRIQVRRPHRWKQSARHSYHSQNRHGNRQDLGRHTPPGVRPLDAPRPRAVTPARTHIAEEHAS